MAHSIAYVDSLGPIMDTIASIPRSPGRLDPFLEILNLLVQANTSLSEKIVRGLLLEEYRRTRHARALLDQFQPASGTGFHTFEKAVYDIESCPEPVREKIYAFLAWYINRTRADHRLLMDFNLDYLFDVVFPASCTHAPVKRCM